MPARFFLSYAHDDDDGHVAKFFDDLVGEVQRQSGISGEEIGFQDLVSMRIGAPWPDDLFEALNTSATFVALCSPSYFASEFCGREWALFATRTERYRRLRGTSAPVMMPVLWVPAPDVPEPVRRLQYTDQDFGPAYAREGLHHLYRLRRYREDRILTVRALARRLLEVAHRHPVPELDGNHSLAEVESAFHGPRARSAAAPAVRSPATRAAAPSRTPADSGLAAPEPRVRRSGPQHVYFVIVAATQREAAEIRAELQHYGPEPFDWAPYRPELDQRISVFAQAVAADQDLSSQLTEAADVVEVLERAGGRNELVVLLVDAWTTRLPTYRDHLVEYDRRNEPSTVVLVPWSEHDTEATDNADKLRRGLAQAFPLNMIRSDDLFRVGIATSGAFRADLAELLVKAQSRVFRKGEVSRWTGAGPWDTRPRLQFPDGEDDR